MADNNANLTIGVGLDLTKLRADKAVLEQEVRGLNRDLNKAAAAGDVAGATSIAGNLIAQEKALAGVKAQWAASNLEAKGLRDTMRELVEHGNKFRELFEVGGGALAGGGGGMLRAIGSLAVANPITAALAVTAGAGGLALHEAAEYSREVEASAHALGLTTGAMDEWITAARRGHVEQDLFVRAMERFGIATEKAAQGQRGLTFETNKLLAAEGAYDIVARGGATDKPRKSTSHIVDASLLNGGNLGPIAAQNLNQLRDVNLDRVRAGQEPFPLPDIDTEIARLRLLAGQDNAQGAKLRELARERGATGIGTANMEEALAAREKKESGDPFTKLNIAATDLLNHTRGTQSVFAEYRTEFRKLNAELANSVQRTLFGKPGINPELQQLFRDPSKDAAFNSQAGASPGIEAGVEVAHFEKSVIETGWRAMIDAGLAEARVAVASAEKLGEMAEAVRHVVGEAWGGVTAAAGATAEALNKIPAAAASAANAMSQIGMGKGSGGELLGNADGGYIRGAGTGTSDSIIARVSNGEFVVNAAATSRNLSLLHAINGGFAMGGMVGFPSIPSFAEGGMVGSRAPVNLHIGGSSYALHGDGGVVDALVAEAHRQNMTSAGVKPSWYAGRPSGR